MKIISLETKRKQKDSKLKIPVYEKLHLDENGEVRGKLVDYIEIPKEIVKRGE
ncbi:hypothetical protein SAMN05216389_103268 [Oceanobacillus limi]|uniref:Uncharacterized protein n=1 Tax=Oceanobacillus limi TaxID=930131 RepID=A0A1I0AIV2_9BACI|nr:hypothetical protein [Oceanobacillus limi]SES94127.1 hypothetical protein SAMN05216389_103268 [Oceanobacillus limi]